MPHPRQSNLAEESYKIFVPEEYLVDFEVNHIGEQASGMGDRVGRKEGRIPGVLAGKEAVLDGYNNEIDILTHAFSLKKIYLRLIRRRWKEKRNEQTLQ
jgi:hypothetical protein